MNKLKLSNAKVSLFTVLSLVSIVLGIGCISLAMIKIGASSVQPADTYRGKDFSFSALAVSPFGLTADKATPTETDEPAGTLDANEKLYPVYPVEGDVIGSLSIPVLKLELPILQGTEEVELEKGVGHFIQSVLPGEEDNCVLSGHRTTVFATLGELKVGDQLTVQTSAGTFNYEVNGTRIVDKDDKTVIVPTDHAVLTLTTCYPFIYVGSAPDRFIVTADLVISE